MNTPTPAPQKITQDRQMAFPRWLWSRYSNSWIRFTCRPNLLGDVYTFHHPDQPTAPTCAPTCTPSEGENCASTIDDPRRVPVQSGPATAHVSPQPTHSAQEAAERLRDRIAMHEGLPDFDVEQIGILLNLIRSEARHFPSTPTQSQQPPLSPGSGEAMREAIAKMEQDLRALRQQVLGAGIGDPWDGEELETGYVRPIPRGFEDEVAKFDKMHSAQIKDINACLEVISELAMRSRGIAEALAQPATPPLTSGEAQFYLMKRGLYYRDKAAGYTDDISEAGRFTKAVADSHVRSTAGEKQESLRVKAIEIPAMTGDWITDAAKDIRYLHRASYSPEATLVGIYENIIRSHFAKSAPPLPSIGDGKDVRERVALAMHDRRNPAHVGLPVIPEILAEYLADADAALAAMSAQSPQAGREEKS